MFKANDTQGDLNGFLDAGSRLEGDLHFDDTFRVDGKFKGTVTSDGDLIIGQDGLIEGEVKVGRVFNSGTIKGKIEAARRVELSSTGRVYGDVVTPALVVEDGAYFEGQCAMVREGGKSGDKGDRDGESVVRPMPVGKKG